MSNLKKISSTNSKREYEHGNSERFNPSCNRFSAKTVGTKNLLNDISYDPSYI